LRVVLLAHRGFDLGNAIILAVFLGPILLAFLWLALVSGTRTTTEALITRGFGRTRVTPWEQVSAIGIESWRGRRTAFTPQQVAVFYDGAGTRRLLPNLIDRGRLDLTHEVTLLRGIWQRHRGPAWEPTPPAPAPARRGHPRLKALGVALAVVLVDFLLLIVAASTLPDPFGGKDPGLAVDILLPLLVIFGPAAVACAITLRTGRSADRTDHHRRAPSGMLWP
jgi:hypothetical protein